MCSSDLLVTVMAAVLMVSNLRYRSFKDLNLKERVPFMAVLGVPLLFVLVFLDPPQVLFLFFVGYAASAPCVAGWRWLRRSSQRRASPEHSKRL